MPEISCPAGCDKSWFGENPTTVRLTHIAPHLYFVHGWSKAAVSDYRARSGSASFGMPEQYTLTLGEPRYGILLDGKLRLKDSRKYLVDVPRGTLQTIPPVAGYTDDGHVIAIEPGHRLLYMGKELFLDPAGEVVQLKESPYYLWSNGRVAILRMWGRDYLWEPFIRFSRLARLIGLRLPPEQKKEQDEPLRRSPLPPQL